MNRTAQVYTPQLYYGLCLLQGLCLFAGMAVPFGMHGGFQTANPHQIGIFVSSFLGLWALLCLGTGVLVLRALKIHRLLKPSRSVRTAVVARVQKKSVVEPKIRSLKLFRGEGSAAVHVPLPSPPQISRIETWEQPEPVFQLYSSTVGE